MKLLTIKDSNISIEGREINRPDGSKLTVKSLIEDILNHPPAAGFSVSEMGDRLKVLGKIKGTDGFDIILEDAEATKLQACAKAMNWAFMHEEIVALDKAIREMAPTEAAS